MNRNKFYFGILCLVLLGIIIWSSTGILNTGKKGETYVVSVIVNDSNNDRWLAMRQGLEQAARDNHMKLNYVSTGKLQTAEEEMALIRREIENGADGIIVQMISGTRIPESLEETFSGTAVMLLETDVNPEGVYAFTGPDNYSVGEAVGKSVIEDMGTDISGSRIGILCGDQSQISMRQRMEGLQSVLEKENVEIVWTMDNLTEEPALTQIKQEERAADIIIALENDGIEWMADNLQNGSEDLTKCRLYGVGCSEKAVYYLDTGVIQTLVVPNEFNMGYQSMEGIAKQLKYRLAKAENCQVDYLVVDESNLYDEDNQKILFPIVQ